VARLPLKKETASSTYFALKYTAYCRDPSEKCSKHINPGRRINGALPMKHSITQLPSQFFSPECRRRSHPDDPLPRCPLLLGISMSRILLKNSSGSCPNCARFSGFVSL